MEIHISSRCEIQTTYVYDNISLFIAKEKYRGVLHIILIFQMMIIEGVKIIFV